MTVLRHLPRTALLLAAALACPVVASGCGAAQTAPMQQPSDVVLSMQDIDCQSCGMRAVGILQQTPGVGTVAFDRNTAELQVHFDAARILPGDMIAALKKADLVARVGKGQGRYLPAATFPEGSDVQWIAKDGADVDILAHRVTGKVTVVDFGAEWCGPCREVDKFMIGLLQRDPDVAVRKIDVGDWESAVAKHYLAEVESLPYLVVFGRDGREIATISGLHLDQLQAAIAKGKGP